MVALVGPATLDAGARAAITFRIQTDAAITGMNAAPSDGTVKGVGDGGLTRSFFDEVVHADAQAPNDAGEAVYTFAFTAPEFGGPVTIYAAGNACNDDDLQQGDRAAATSFVIEVNGPPRPLPEAAPPPPPPPVIDAGAIDAGADASEPEKKVDDSGCMVVRVGEDGASMLGAGATLVLALLRLRRRRTL